MKVNKSPVKFYASAKAVINQFLHLPGSDRVKNIIGRIENFTEEQVNNLLAQVLQDFASRHRDIENVFRHNFEKVSKQFNGGFTQFSKERKLLTGAFFTKEYSIQAAALFNPSIVPHPSQQGLQPGSQRFVMSLRATGEGHISSIVFKTGIINEASQISFDQEPSYFTRLQKNKEATYSREFIKERANFLPGLKKEAVEKLPENFTAAEAIQLLKKEEASFTTVEQLENMFDANYELQPSSRLPINEKVIFPAAKAECMGMEDVRFVKFTNGDAYCFYGTYTAYNGKNIQTQLIETTDFNVFKIRALYGHAISDKGMALFPEKVNGKYVMVSRQGGEKMNIMYSDDLYFWPDYQLLMEPQYPWELVQLGNCGSPIKTTKGWLLLTHGVGPMRTYVISAILLDLTNPSKIIARLNKPLLFADEEEREGYVPNVVYTCGMLLHNDTLIIPYAVSDSATGFATLALNELMDEMKILN